MTTTVGQNPLSLSAGGTGTTHRQKERLSITPSEQGSLWSYLCIIDEQTHDSHDLKVA